MAALVQTFPQQTAVSMMQRPGSADHYRSSSSSQIRHTPKQNSLSNTGYRGAPGPAPAYAFTSTPQLGTTVQRQHQQSPHTRSSSSPGIPQLPQLNLGPSSLSQRPASIVALPTNANAGRSGSSDDAVLSLNKPAPVIVANVPKASPDRYRRNVRRTDSGDVPTRASVGSQLYHHPAQSSSSPSLSTYQPSAPGSSHGVVQGLRSADDMQVSRPATDSSRYRRRSLGNIDVSGIRQPGDAQGRNSSQTGAYARPRPSSSHAHSGSADSVNSLRSGVSRVDSSRFDSSPTVSQPTATNYLPKVDSRHLNVSTRPNDNNRRIPSPLSQPSPLTRPTETHIPNAPSRSRPNTPKISSPAAEHLAALNQKDHKKSKSKLRRAFSFGSSAELRKATAQVNLEKNQSVSTGPTPAGNKRNSKYQDELEPEQARIAEKQEAAGLGESIYSGQGNFFTGSTDNLSISSTASSASIMLRKMGQGVKKGTRSFVGLFRPKSVLGVPAADGPVNQASAAQISMVTVEAEREKVNINLDPHEHAGGGTGFPKLERNSLDNKMSIESGNTSNESWSRRSIVGGEKERAEVLAAVKKGILKRTDSNQSSPSLRQGEGKVGDFSRPGMPQVNDSPRSSAPSTPRDDPPRSGHRRTESITIETNDHDDYFSSFSRYASTDSKTATPLTASSVRNISFSPRIQFHDTWPSGEYDRRGDIATCNRLTPMLAQQIKEELNTFKMEMEVHESSKVYTHFF